VEARLPIHKIYQPKNVAIELAAQSRDWRTLQII
jgi:hypothetical protein